MRFKTFYLQEKEEKSFRQIADLTNIIAGCADKSIEGEDKRENGLYFQISSIGSWSVLKTKLAEALSKWKDKSTDSTNLKFENGKLTLYVKFEKNTAKFYYTKKKVDAPEWESKEDKEQPDNSKAQTEEPSPKDDSDNADADSDEYANK